MENTTSGRKPGPSDLQQARRLREGDDAVVVVEDIVRVRDNAWETGSSKKVQDEACGVDDDDDSSSNENDVFTGEVLHLRAGDNPTTDPTTDIVGLGEVEMGQISDPFLPSMNLQPLSPNLFVDKSPTQKFPIIQHLQVGGKQAEELDPVVSNEGYVVLTGDGVPAPVPKEYNLPVACELVCGGTSSVPREAHGMGKFVYYTSSAVEERSPLKSVSYTRFDSGFGSVDFGSERRTGGGMELQMKVYDGLFHEIFAFSDKHSVPVPVIESSTSYPSDIETGAQRLRLISLFNLWSPDRGRKFAIRSPRDGLEMTRSIILRKM